MPESNKNVRPRGADSARVIEVIETRSMRGIGTQDDLCREVIQYWDFHGNLLAEYDPDNFTISEHCDQQEGV